MQLTPRTLTLALGACLAGGLVIGVAGAIGPAVSASSAAPEPTATVANFPQTELGDSEISFPSPIPSPSQRPAAVEIDQVLTGPQGQHIDQMLTFTALGRPEAVRDYLADFGTYADADELLVAHHAESVDGRLRSLDMLGAQMALATV